VWYGGTSNEALVLASAYKDSLKIAESKKLSSISFPSISTGAYRYPLEQAARVALETVIWFLEEEAVSLKEVRFVLFDARTYAVFQKTLREKTENLSGKSNSTSAFLDNFQDFS
jgi:O-acetyl-ADP-ribose deacetylase (regulator of RNase III)